MQITIEENDILSEMEAVQMAPLTLAYMGDCIFDMVVRTYLVTHSQRNAGALHSMSIKVVNARSQAAFAHSIMGGLTEREQAIFMRARNAKSATVPKNMSVSDYHYATAVEAVVGYLYLTGQTERLNELLGRLGLSELN